MLSHLPELIIVLVLGVMIFGARRLPEIGSSVAQTIKNFQHGMKEEPITPPAPPPTTMLPPTTSEAPKTDVPTPQS